MLEQLGKHGGFDLTIDATGDLEVDLHHTVEDVGIVLGTALKEALGDKAGVRRFASALVPLDEALVQVALDLSGRPFLVYEVDPVVGVDRHLRPAARRGVLARVRVRGRDHAAHALALGAQRPPRDRGVVQGRRPRRCATRCKIEGDGRAVAPRARCDRAAPRLISSIPAIDLRGGPVRAAAPGRLRRPRRSTTTTRSRSRARSRPPGAPWIHVVDLDAARTGEPANLAAIEAIAAAVPCRSRPAAACAAPKPPGALLGAGVDACRRRHRRGGAARARRRAVRASIPGAIAVGLDARGREVAVRGWVEGSGVDLVELAARFEDVGRRGARSSPRSAATARIEGPDLDQLGVGARPRPRSR